MKTHIQLIWILGLLSLACINNTSWAQSIADKKASLQENDSGLDRDLEQLLSQVNKETEEIQKRIKHLYEEAMISYEHEASEDQYRNILDEINENKRLLNQLENNCLHSIWPIHNQHSELASQPKSPPQRGAGWRRGSA